MFARWHHSKGQLNDGSYLSVTLPVDEEAELVDTHRTCQLIDSDLLQSPTTNADHKPMTDDPSSPSKKLIRKTRTRNFDGIEL